MGWRSLASQDLKIRVTSLSVAYVVGTQDWTLRLHTECYTSRMSTLTQLPIRVLLNPSLHQMNCTLAVGRGSHAIDCIYTWL